MKKSKKQLNVLAEMLTYRRPAGSDTEAEFIQRFIDSVPGMKMDDYGNRYIRIGESNVMFSCHTDSVHDKPGRQRVCHDPILNEYFTDDPDSSCLGADDATGVYIMLQLIKRKRPGLYVFHIEEEVGGRGSEFFANSRLFSGIDQCIAFDRKGKKSVITHQMGGRCASKEYASALCNLLGDFQPDSTGTFTDSANYMHLIPECTNISVGYNGAHSSKETQCALFPDKLVELLVMAPLEQLPIVRDPVEAIEFTSFRNADDDAASFEELMEFVTQCPEGAVELLMSFRVEKSEIFAYH